MEKVDTLVVDKTGTLTEGKPAVTRIIAADGFEEHELLRIAAGVERASEHPLALALVDAALARDSEIPEVSDFDSHTGKGGLGVVQGQRITPATDRFRDEEGAGTEPPAAHGEQHR